MPLTHTVAIISCCCQYSTCHSRVVLCKRRALLHLFTDRMHFFGLATNGIGDVARARRVFAALVRIVCAKSAATKG